MKLLCVLGLLLLSCGVVEADDFRFEMPKPYDHPPVDATIIWCTNWVCASPCESKMKEVMREVNEILRLNHESLNSRKPGEARICFNLSPILYQWWSNVMKECVQ